MKRMRGFSQNMLNDMEFVFPEEVMILSSLLVTRLLLSTAPFVSSGQSDRPDSG